MTLNFNLQFKQGIVYKNNKKINFYYWWLILGYIKETAEVIKDSLKGISNKKKFKKLVDNMIFAIDTKTVSEYFEESNYYFETFEKGRDGYTVYHSQT